MVFKTVSKYIICIKTFWHFVWITNILKSVYVVSKLYWWTALGCLITRGMLFQDKNIGVF